MKNLSSTAIFILLLLANSIGLFAQQKSLLNNIEIISEREMAAHQRLVIPHEQLIENNYDIKYHRFFWFVDPAVTFISGSVTTHFVVTQSDVSSIQFELSSGMSADSAFHEGSKYDVEHSENVITVPLGSTVSVGTLDSVTVFYHGNPTTTGFGSFGDTIHGGAPGMWTLSEPYGASDWWPSKNDLTDKIDSIDVFVVTPNGNHVASNGLLISETPYGTDATLAHWKHRYPIVSYLIAIASTNYARFSDYLVTGTDSLEVLNYVYPEDSVMLRARAAEVLPSITLFEDLFTPYPFRAEKYGQAQFGWGGGMEHQTMTFLGKGAFNVETMAHELAHQWFGDMITCGSWQDIWLNEGFATYCAGLRYENIDQFYWPIWKHNVISFVCYKPDGSVFCDDTTTVDRIFDSRLSYCKGAMLLHMLRWVVGDEDFFSGVQNYLNDPALQHGFALTPDFIAHMEASSGRDLTGFFNDWYTGQGFPTYSVSYSQLPDYTVSVSIAQSQSHASVNFFELPVPLQFFGGDKDTTIVFNHTFSGELFTANPGFAIDSILFDPELWLVSANNVVTSAKELLPDGKILTLQPNPASDFLSIQHNLEDISLLQIVDIEGKPQKVKLLVETATLLKINVQQMKPGVYLLKVGYKGGAVTRKFVVSN